MRRPARARDAGSRAPPGRPSVRAAPCRSAPARRRWRRSCFSRRCEASTSVRESRPMKRCLWLVSLILVLPGPALAQAEADDLEPILKEELLAPVVALHQLREHIVQRVPKPPAPRSAAEWTEAAKS